MEKRMAPKGHLSERARKAISLASMGVFVLFFVAVFWFVGRPMLEFVAEPERFRLWVQGHGWLGKLAFVGMMTLQVVVAVIPGEPLEIGAGYAYGAVEGTLLCLVGCVVGSVVIYLFVRYFGRKAVEVFFPAEKIAGLTILQNPRRLNMMVFLAFFIPGTPKDLLTYAVGLTSMPLGTFLGISTVARIPSVITSTVGGDALGMQNYQFAIVVFVCTVLISGAGLLLFHHMNRKSGGA